MMISLEGEWMLLFRWTLLCVLVGWAFSFTACGCGDHGDDSDDDKADDTAFFMGDDNAQQDDDEADCSETGFATICLVSFQGTCIDVIKESDFMACKGYCDTLNARPIGVDDTYCVCCRWIP